MCHVCSAFLDSHVAAQHIRSRLQVVVRYTGVLGCRQQETPTWSTMPPQVISVVQKTAGRVFQDSPPFRIAAEDHDPSERKYKHVYYHSTSTTWQIVRGGFPNVMCHLDQDTVAARAAKARGVSLKSLRLAPSKPKPEERISYPRVCVTFRVQGGRPRHSSGGWKGHFQRTPSCVLLLSLTSNVASVAYWHKASRMQ